MKNFILTIFLFSFYGCASYINEMHRDLDRQENILRPRPNINTFDQYRRENKASGRTSLTSKYVKNLKPSVKRKYVPKSRAKAEDLYDNEKVGSLWSGSGNDSYLFTKNTEKKLGDIIIIDVFKKFKDEIVLELKRAFPDPAKEAKNKDKDNTATPTTPTATGASEKDNSKSVDRISSVIIEEINQDHLLLRGRKSLLYKRRKRLLEIQVLVARKDISDDDSVSSNKILESSVHVLR